MTAVLGARATVADLLDQRAAELPAHAALVCGERRVGYGELAEQVGALAAGLAARGIGAGDAVALLAGDGPEFVVGFLATVRAGAVAVPLNPGFKPAEIAFCLREARVRAVLVDGQAPPGVPAITIAAALAVGRRTREAPAPPALDADAVFEYSSGATGRPKRVPRTHRQLGAEAEAFVAAAGLTPADVIFCSLPLFHTYGLGCCLLAALGSGATLLFVEDPGPLALDRRRILALLEHARATVFPAVPFQLRMLAEAARGEDLSALRLCFSAANALPRATFEAFERAFAVAPRQLYGCTEAGVVTVNLDPDPQRTAASVGTPVAGVELTVLDAEGAPVEAGRLGEITIGSAAMTRGYAGVSAAVNRAAFPGGAFLTGDRGRVDEAGRLFLTGRRKRLIDVSGDKVDPVQVEDVLAVHPRVRDVVVVGAESGVEGEELVKAVVVVDGRCGERELIRFCRERLADYKAPRIVEFRDDIPRGSHGEVLRKYLV